MHKEFLQNCISNTLIPNNLRFGLDPLIGNHNETFLNNWYGNIEKFLMELIRNSITFCESKIHKTEMTAKMINVKMIKQTDFSQIVQ